MFVKIVVQFVSSPNTASGSSKVEYDLEREIPLSNHISNLCQRLNVPGDPGTFVLQFETTKHYLEDADLTRAEFSIPNGSSFLLKIKPAVLASNYLQYLQDPNINTKKKAIFEVRGLLKDEAFAHEFLNHNGITYITNLISEATGNTLAYALSALQEAMSYGFGFDSLPQSFIQKIVTCIDSTNLNVCRSALEILILLSNSPKYGFKTLESAFTTTARQNDKPPFANLINLLATPDVNIQLNTLTLINNLIKFSDSEYQSFTKSLEKLGIDLLLKKNSSSSDTDFKKQLYIYQKFKLKELKTQRETSYSKQNQEHEETLLKLWTITFPTVKLETRVSEQWKLLGFQGTDPATDFRGMGLLGLQNLIYFAENFTDTFRKIVTVQAERKERDYPVAVAGINVTQMLCDLLKVFQDAEQTGGPVPIFPILFDHPKAFEELYCVSFRVLDSTWDEMNASYMDFPRVIAAVKKQISDVLASNPTSIDQFNKVVWSGTRGVKQPTAAEEEEERSNDPEPVNKLRAKIKQEMFELIKEQRLSFLFEGNWFKIPSKAKAKQTSFIYLKISDNKQEILCGTSATNTTVPELSVAAKLSEVSDMVSGVNIPMFAKQKKLSPQDEEIASFSFSLLFKEPGKASLDFTASTKDDFVHWTDALRLLLSDKIENSDTFDEIKTLTNLELRIRLLDLEGIQIPQQAPPIPATLANEQQD